MPPLEDSAHAPGANGQLDRPSQFEDSDSTSTVRGLKGLGGPMAFASPSMKAAQAAEQEAGAGWRNHRAFDWLSNMDRGAGACARC